nr:uncharacterized protein LOC117607902 isoform X1 [Osmia lignaria]
MKRIVNKNYMYDLELQSLHYWFKNTASQNPLNKYNNVLKIMQNTIYKNDVSGVTGTDIQDCKNIIQRSHINFHNRRILRNVFEHWKIYVIHKLHTRRDMYKANYYYNKKLQKMVLNILSKNVLLKWQHIVLSTNNYSNNIAPSVNYMKAEKHYTKTLLKQYFTFWLKYISIKNRKKILLEKAVTLYNIHFLKKCIFNWKIYVMQQRQKKAMQDRAYKFYTKGILKKYMAAWISFCEFTSLKDKINNAIVFHNNKLLLRYFCAWKRYYKIKLQKLNIEEYIQTYYKKKLLKQYFKQFIMNVNESIADKMAQENAITFYNFKLMQKAFTAWQCWYNKRIENAVRICKIQSIFESKKKLQVLSNWRLYVFTKKCKRRKVFMSQNFYKKNLAIKVVRKLHSYAIYKKEKRIKLHYLDDKSKNIIQKLQYIYIERWRLALCAAVQEKQKLSQAMQFCELNLTRKYFFHWKDFSQQYKIKMLHKQNLYAVATGFLLKKFILRWHDKLKDVLVVRKKESLVISMIEHKMMRKCIVSWKQYVARKLEMKSHIEMAKELHKKFLLREGLKEILRNSLHSIDDEYDMQLENVLTRSFTNFEILKEYFDRWYFLIYLKNQSKSSCQIINDTSHLFHPQILSNNVFDNLENSCLILPEYMKKKVTIKYTK